MNTKKPSFTFPFMDFENMEQNNEKTIELYRKIKRTGDHRSQVILSGIIVEYHLDRLLQNLFIDYEILTEKTEFTFSLKISILRALRLIPPRILNFCDCIRKTRNDFAHKLQLESIEDIDRKVISKIIQCHKELESSSSSDKLINKFEAIHNVVSGELRSYEQNFKLLREKLDSKEFIDELSRINNERIYIKQQELINKGPLKVIDRGKEIEEVYTKTFSIIKSKKN